LLISFMVVSCHCAASFVTITTYADTRCSGAITSLASTNTDFCDLGQKYTCSRNNVTFWSCSSANCNTGCTAVASIVPGCDCPSCSVSTTCDARMPSPPPGFVGTYLYQDSPNCKGDADVFEAVLKNSCNNGTYFTCSGQTITVKVCGDDMCSTKCNSYSFPAGCLSTSASSSVFYVCMTGEGEKQEDGSVFGEDNNERGSYISIQD